MSNVLAPTAGPRPDVTADPTLVVTVVAKPRESIDSLVAGLATRLRQKDATIVALFAYGDVSAREEATKVLRRYLGAIDWPVLWVEGRSCNGALVAGMQAFAVRGVEVERVLVKGRVVGTTYSDRDARHCVLAGLGPDDPHIGREEQAHSTFENLRAALEHAGFDFSDLVRTWFYNEKLLEWYDGFNRARTHYYAERPFRSGSVPASTGVEARNPLGAALAIGAAGFQPLSRHARATEIASPLQCTALNYGSSFSRAMELESAGWRRLSISGTASIAPDGRSLWQGDITKQVATTMEVIDAILATRGMQFADVTRATAYFKYPLDAAAFEAWQVAHGIALPAVFVHCDICRDDLLFELELDAAVRV